MLDMLTGALESTGLGAIVGGFFGWLNKKEERKQQAQDNKHELELRKWDARETMMSQRHELEVADKEIQRAETEGQIAIEAREADGWVESIKQGFKNTGIVWVDAIRGLMRPAITVIMIIACGYLLYVVNTHVDGIDSIPEGELLEIYKRIINSILFGTMTAVTWWFGSRPQSKAGR